MKHLFFYFVSLLLLSGLAACGTGGGGGTTDPGSSRGTSIGNEGGVTSGSTTTSSTQTQAASDYPGYNLNLGTPDGNGAQYVKRYDNTSNTWQLSSPLYFWGLKLTGYTNNCVFIRVNTTCDSGAGPSIGKPSQEVLDAWSNGWTGKGVNILMEDFLHDKDKFHGVITSLIAYRYAPGANLYGLNIANSTFPISSNPIVSLDNQTYQGPVLKLGVVNVSYVADLNSLTGQRSGWTDAQLAQAKIDYAPSALIITNRFQNTAYNNQVNYSDAVITKAAGNDKLAAHQEPLNKALTNVPDVQNRLLIVGALDKAGSTTSPVDMASYSNTAGTDTAVNSRFLLASGTVPFDDGSLVVNGYGVTATGNMGTSYAAPRVAGMVAIVRSKFPNLTASQTATIMLNTARYDTLSCYTTKAGCDKTIYGNGEASLSRALAPVGKLH